MAANEAFERVASIGLMPNMILYLTRVYGMQIATAANVLFLWSAASNFMPILGAFLADSYVGRYRMIGFGSIVSLLVNFPSKFTFFSLFLLILSLFLKTVLSLIIEFPNLIKSLVMIDKCYLCSLAFCVYLIHVMTYEMTYEVV